MDWECFLYPAALVILFGASCLIKVANVEDTDGGKASLVDSWCGRKIKTRQKTFEQMRNVKNY